MSKMRFFALQELSNRKPLEVTAPSCLLYTSDAADD